MVWGKSKDAVNPLDEKIVAQELPITNVVKQHGHDLSGAQPNGLDVSSAPTNGGSANT